jgi:hypothetical protein
MICRRVRCLFFLLGRLASEQRRDAATPYRGRLLLLLLLRINNNSKCRASGIHSNMFHKSFILGTWSCCCCNACACAACCCCSCCVCICCCCIAAASFFSFDLCCTRSVNSLAEESQRTTVKTYDSGRFCNAAA